MNIFGLDMGDLSDVIRGAREAITGEKIVDPVELARIDVNLKQLEQAIYQGQLKVNETEAKHASIFVAGWRPSVGWVCSLALFYQFIGYPLMIWAWVYLGQPVAEAPPVVDSTALYPILLGMLGVGGMRSFDKLKGKDTRRIG